MGNDETKDKDKEKEEEEIINLTEEDFLLDDEDNEEDNVSLLKDKISSLERTIGGLSSTVDRFIEASTKTLKSDDIDLDNNMPITAKEINKILDNREKHTLSEKNKYEKNYIETIRDIGSKKKDSWNKAVIKELEQNNSKYLKHTGYPEADAKINYSEAEKAVILRSGKVNLKLDSTKAPLNPKFKNKVDVKKVGNNVNLDNHAKKLIAKLGLNDDKVKNYLQDSE